MLSLLLEVGGLLLNRGFRSTQMHTAPLAFGTKTILVHHSVGILTFEITPKLSILLALLGLSLLEIMAHFVECTKHEALHLLIAYYSSFMLPKPVNNSGILSGMLF